MILQALETYGTLISFLAVVVSIAGLAASTRQHTRSLQTANYGRALDRLAAIQARLSADPDMARLFAVGMRTPHTLSVEDRIRMTWALYEMFGAFEFMHDQARIRALPSPVWRRWAETIAWWASLPGVQAWWASKPAPFNLGFTRFVDGLIAAPRVDAEAATRWQAFLRAPTPLRDDLPLA